MLRTKEVFQEKNEARRGRFGKGTNLRSFHRYTVPTSESEKELLLNGVPFVGSSRENLDHRAVKGEKSKARLILEFLREHPNMAVFTKQIAEEKSLKDAGVRQGDVMMAIRPASRRNFVLIRGYDGEDTRTPFKEGFIVTWISQDVPLDQAISEAYERTERTLYRSSNPIPVVQRIHKIRSLLIEAVKAGMLRSPNFIKNELRCTDDEYRYALKRAMQLYPDIIETKLFGAYPYFHHVSMPPEVLKVATIIKKNYVRRAKGRE